MSSHRLAVFIGRFQPFHLGHQFVVDEALEVSDRVLILIGSSFEPRSIRNPWSYDEREAMIRSCFNAADNDRIICRPIRDIRYSDTLWLSQIQKAVYEIIGDNQNDVALIGKHSQGLGYYTTLFPQWKNASVEHNENITGTELRKAFFGADTKKLDQHTPPTVAKSLTAFAASADGQDLKQEYDFIRAYQKGWENSPFPPTHVTVDAVVVQSGHVLVVRRGARPGKGQLALPGGFISHDETLVNAVIRKLKEETNIKVPVPALIGSIKAQSVFDAPFRSTRGRTLTHAFHIELRSEESLPKIKGGGESENCLWLPLGQIDSTEMFEDHYFIIQKMLGTV